MAQLLFGSGALWGERVDNRIDQKTPASGTGPIQFGIVQKTSVNWSFTDKKVYGQQQFPIAIVRGQGAVDGKAANAQFNMLLFSDIFFGLTPEYGQLTVQSAETITIPFSGAVYNYVPFHVDTYQGDLGVRYADTGDHFQRFNGPPGGAGSYDNAFGDNYAFSEADAGREVTISYLYTIPAAGGGRGLRIINQQQGVTPFWSATFFHDTSPGQAGAGTTDQPFTLHLNACVSSKLTLPNSAIDAWTIPELDFEAFTDEFGDVGLLSMVQP